MSSVSSKVAVLKGLGWSDDLIASILEADQVLDLGPDIAPDEPGSTWRTIDSGDFEFTLSQAAIVSGKDVQLK